MKKSWLHKLLCNKDLQKFEKKLKVFSEKVEIGIDLQK